MKLTGKETHIVSGALLIYLGAPLLYAKRRYGKGESALLQDLFDRFVTKRNRVFAAKGIRFKEGVDPKKVIARELQATMEWTFTEKEKTFLRRVLAVCALESIKHDMSVFFGGGGYRIKAVDYLNLCDRIRKET